MDKDDNLVGRATSPLRYPGGKSCLYGLASTLLRTNGLERTHYAEPFAGGCGLALNLLYQGHVSDIHINDIDLSVWSFWYIVLNDTERLVQKIEEIDVTVAEWQKQKAIHRNLDSSDTFERGFSTFFLNRTNRSGVIKEAGVIGGLDQDGPYKIDCRFNRVDLARRIRRVAKYRNRIHLSRLDALDFLEHARSNLPASAFLCIDPPYYRKGSKLYTSFYTKEDHAALASSVLSLDKPWVVTYDNAAEISSLYRGRRQFEFDINYSLETKRRGTELLIVSKGLRVPYEIRGQQVNRPQYRKAA